MSILVGENDVEALPYWFRGNVHFLFFQNLYDLFCSGKSQAVDGKAKNYSVGKRLVLKARTYGVVSHSRHGEGKTWEGLPNYRLQLTALAASAAGSLK
jgi:hypothetical protein